MNMDISMQFCVKHLKDTSFLVFVLEMECRLFPPVTIFLDLFPRAGYFFNALYWNQRNFQKVDIFGPVRAFF